MHFGWSWSGARSPTRVLGAERWNTFFWPAPALREASWSILRARSGSGALFEPFLVCFRAPRSILEHFLGAAPEHFSNLIEFSCLFFDF